MQSWVMVTAHVRSFACVVLGGFRREHFLQELKLFIPVPQPALQLDHLLQ